LLALLNNEHLEETFNKWFPDVNHWQPLLNSRKVKPSPRHAGGKVTKPNQ
jgi:hypothetical protein